jgi:hypothetical protein
MTDEKPNKKDQMAQTPHVKEMLHREEDIKKHKEKANRLNQETEEFGGQEGLDPTRHGDWEKGGRCTDF